MTQNLLDCIVDRGLTSINNKSSLSDQTISFSPLTSFISLSSLSTPFYPLYVIFSVKILSVIAQNIYDIE